MTEIAAIAAGALGAVTRYGVTGWVQRRVGGLLPLGTATVNLLGAFSAGVAAGLAAPGSIALAVGAGFLGGFTTFSTWMHETVALAGSRGRHTVAVINLIAVLLVGLALAAGGYFLAD